MLNLYFLIVITPIILIIMQRNYQSAVFKYQIFDRNQNPNIRLPYYSKTHSPNEHTTARLSFHVIPNDSYASIVFIRF